MFRSYPELSLLEGVDGSFIDAELLSKADQLRGALGAPLIITSAFRINDKGSQHALGLALDIMAPQASQSLMDMYLLAAGIGFKGIGVYPHWKYMGHTYGGLHIDMRVGKEARWMGVSVPDPAGGAGATKQKYIKLSPENLKLYGVIS